MNNSAMLIVVDEAIEFACRQGTAEMDLAKMAHFDLILSCIQINTIYDPWPTA